MRWTSAWLTTLLGAALAHAEIPASTPPELESSLAGRVCHDVDGDGACQDGEPGLSSVRLVLASGREVRTDGSGRYHFAGLDGRSPEDVAGVRLRLGRQRLKVDARSLPSGARLEPASVTVELPWGALVKRDFAVALPASAASEVREGYLGVAPSGAIVPGGFLFLVAGVATPGARVEVAGAPVEVSETGAYRAFVRLERGPNTVPIQLRTPDGAVALLEQPVDVVERPAGALVVPRPIRPVGRLRLPGTSLASGPTRLRVEAPAGSRVKLGDVEVELGPSGAAELPVTLVPGEQRVRLSVQRPGEEAREDTVVLVAAPAPFAVGLVDLEGSWSPTDGRFRLQGRGAAHGEWQRGRWRLRGEIDLADTDAPLRETPEAWLSARRPDRFERALDPDRSPAGWGDDSLGLATNPSEGRLRIELSHGEGARVGVGTRRVWSAEGEVGRYHRPLFGPFAEWKARLGPAQVGARSYWGGLDDPLRGLSTAPAHEELRATGGSLYYLGSSAIVEGSEVVRVELRDGVSGLPIAERHLVRGVDYELDSLAGRLLLARPLSFVEAGSGLATDPLSARPEPVLVIDYAALQAGSGRRSRGAEAWAVLGPGRLSLSGVQEWGAGSPYRLATARAQVTARAFTLTGEVSASEGEALGLGALGVSDDGGLSFLRPLTVADGAGLAWGVRLRGEGVDAAYRQRSAGFSDGARTDPVDFRQLSLRVERGVGPMRFTLLGDDRLGVDPRAPWGTGLLGARTAGAAVGYEAARWGARLELRDTGLRASELPGTGPLESGGRTSVGVHAHARVHPSFELSAGHRQAIVLRGEGAGRVDDSFSSGGIEWVGREGARLGVFGGWGPVLGPQAWLSGEVQRGPETFYGAYSVDVDGVDFGARRAVSGARTEVARGASVFVEDVSAHDAQSIRMARAVGFQQAVGDGLRVEGRYERGVRHPLGIASALARDAAGASLQWVRARVRLHGRAEVRHERGVPARGEVTDVDRWQTVASLGSDVKLVEGLTLAGRLNASQTQSGGEVLARFLEGFTTLAWRRGPGLVLARYSVTRERSPPPRDVFSERTLQVYSLLPSLELGRRLSVAAGAHAGRSSVDGDSLWVFTGSLRPAVQVHGGFETAVELARRSAAPDGGSLTALRGELGYRMDAQLKVAAGYTFLGFSGLGVSAIPDGAASRLYVRAEVAY